MRSYAYIRSLGAEGLQGRVRDRRAQRQLPARAAAQLGVAEQLPLAFGELCMHEFVLSGAPMKRELRIRTLDLAKRLLDHGFHPPTVYFPLLVDEALLIEPTETETRETLDAFAEVVADDPARGAPRTRRSPATRPTRPCLGVGIGMAYVPAERGAARRRAGDRRRGKRSVPPWSRKKPLYAKETNGDASYPEDLLYHAEHDWARIDDDVATMGITWFAQDALGEVVFFDPPEVGTSIKKDEPYAEVESVKAVSDVIAPLSGEIVEVNTALGDNPEEDQRGPLR